jgi:hypothetical protein
VLKKLDRVSCKFKQLFDWQPTKKGEGLPEKRWWWPLVALQWKPVHVLWKCSMRLPAFVLMHFVVEEVYSARYQSGSFSLINLGSDLNCLHIYSLLSSWKHNGFCCFLFYKQAHIQATSLYLPLRACTRIQALQLLFQMLWKWKRTWITPPSAPEKMTCIGVISPFVFWASCSPVKKGRQVFRKIILSNKWNCYFINARQHGTISSIA